jgi:prefoldin subunit 5
MEGRMRSLEEFSQIAAQAITSLHESMQRLDESILEMQTAMQRMDASILVMQASMRDTQRSVHTLLEFVPVIQAEIIRLDSRIDRVEGTQ